VIAAARACLRGAHPGGGRSSLRRWSSLFR
jgi:hypothetical protein